MQRFHSGRRALTLLGLAVALVGLWLMLVPSTKARIHPYYIVVTTAYNVPNPRILFALDTSGSMSRRADATNTNCLWSECEEAAHYGTVNESRISSARRAINSVITATTASAKFGLVTFDQNGAPSSTPGQCSSGGPNYRFGLVTHMEPSGAPAEILRNWDTGLANYYPGVYRVCGGSDRRPFVYLRWDNLGEGSVIAANNQVGGVPASPLISHEQADFTHVNNTTRKAQWFPRYMGTRIQLNSANDPTQAIALSTVGDYDPTLGEVWGHDFYYWPYVDGFPGYGTWDVWADVSETGHSDGYDFAGISSPPPSFGAKLWAPFYLDLSSTAVNPNFWGPADEASATAEVLQAVSPLIEGGVDAVGQTPWYSVIGPIPASPTQSNSVFAHTTIGGYLKFVTNINSPDQCAATSLVMLTDGDPSPSGEGGAGLYGRIADLRKDIDIRTYVVGFFLGSTSLNDMACAGAGACDGTCSTPCLDTPEDNWDTCRDPANPTTDCAYLANSTAELEAVLLEIISDAIDVDVSSGPGGSLNQFGVGADGNLGEGVTVQTKLHANTEYPDWKGHVIREYCTLEQSPGVLEPFCQAPSPEFAPSETEPTFGPCPQSRAWDAGDCLQQTVWNDRRIYSYDTSNNVYRISNPDGTASAAFVADLLAEGLIPGVAPQAEADDIAAFVLGRDATDGWKLYGVANSAPVKISRISPYRSERVPEVNVNDPHCAGRRFGALDSGEIPPSLRDFAADVWDDTNTFWYLNTPGDHYAYQEAIAVGSDAGLLHFFQFDSGNELMAVLPRPLLSNVALQAAQGAAVRGQPENLGDHIYGLAATVNQGWVYDSVATVWRHLVVFGFGPGGQDYVAMDVQHLSPSHPAGQFEVLWSTEDATLKAGYDLVLGETWARPALSYHLDPDELTSTPEAFVVFGSGYPDSPATDPTQGRRLIAANALTGQILDDATVPLPSGAVYETDYTAMVDPAIATQCLSRYWAEAQETYVADPAGRLFRWDLGRDTTPLTFTHQADSAPATATAWAPTAEPLTQAVTPDNAFPSCEGSGATCTVSASNPGDPFIFAPAVSANNRITDTSEANSATVDTNQYLIALNSGSPNDDSTDWGATPQSDFHSSLYLLVDDHSQPADYFNGMTIPAGAPKSASGPIGAGATFLTDANYVRLAFSDITRTRTVEPYPGATPLVTTREFGRATRPVRPPRILVTGVAQDPTDPVTIIEGVEVYYVTFTVHEPGDAECDPAFFDAANHDWYFDHGSTYEITFRLTTDETSGFDFTTGAQGGTADFGAGFEEGLTLESVTQLVDNTTCPGGVCGPQPGAPGPSPCDENASSADMDNNRFAIPLAARPVNAFTPVE